MKARRDDDDVKIKGKTYIVINIEHIYVEH